MDEEEWLAVERVGGDPVAGRATTAVDGQEVPVDDLGAAYASVQLLSRIGAPVDEPWAVDVATTAGDERRVCEIVREELADLDSLTRDLIAGRIDTF